MHVTLFLWDRQAQEQPLREHHLVRAHMAATQVLADWEAREAGYARQMVIRHAVGACVPLLGVTVLHWPVGAVVLSLFMDTIVMWMCEVLKTLLEPRRTQVERAGLLEALDVRTVILSMKQPRRALQARGHRADKAQDTLQYRYGALLEPEVYTPIEQLIFMMSLGFLMLALLALAWGMMPAAFPGLLASIALRIGFSVLSIRRAARRDGPAPELLRETLEPSIAFWIVLGALFVFGMLTDGKYFNMPVVGVGVLILHAFATLVIARIGWRNIHAFVIDLRRFVVRDRQEMLDQLQRVNGDTRGDGPARSR